MTDAFAETCYELLTRQLADGPARVRAQERLRTHAHFTVLRDLLQSRQVVPVPSAARAVLVETVDGSLLLPPHDAVQLPIVARYGAFQRDDLLAALAFLEQQGTLRGRVFVDIGANVGSHTLHALRSGRFERAVAVEPCPSNVHLLTLNMRLNALTERVDVVACALGSAAGTIDLMVNPLNCGDARLAAEKAGDALGEPDFERTPVPVLPFDDLMASLGHPPDDLGLVWMDTQGSEGHILAASRILAETAVPLYVEFWPYGMKALDSYGALKSFVEAHCTAVVTFEGGKAHPHPTCVLDALYGRYDSDERFIDLLLLR